MELLQIKIPFDDDFLKLPFDCTPMQGLGANFLVGKIVPQVARSEQVAECILVGNGQPWGVSIRVDPRSTHRLRLGDQPLKAVWFDPALVNSPPISRCREGFSAGPFP